MDGEITAIFTRDGFTLDIAPVSGKDSFCDRELLDESGREVYGVGTADPAFAARDGLAGYSEDLGLAMEDARVGDNPVVTRATRLSHGSGIVIPSIAASMVRDAPYDFVSECRVIIVCGQGAD